MIKYWVQHKITFIFASLTFIIGLVAGIVNPAIDSPNKINDFRDLSFTKLIVNNLSVEFTVVAAGIITLGIYSI